MAAAMASPWPVFPDVGFTMVPPGFSTPARSAASIIRTPMRSFTLPPGFSISSLARMAGFTPWATRRSRTSGVLPMASRNVPRTCIPPSRLPDALHCPRRGPRPPRVLCADELEDPVWVAEVDPALRSALHRQDAFVVREHDLLGGHPEAARRERDPPDLAGVVRAEEQPVPAARPQSAAVAEHDAGGGDGRCVEALGEDPWCGPAVVRVLGRLAVAGLVRAPPEVAALHDPVQLVVALRAVLGLPKPAGDGVERHPERVPVAVGPDPAAGERVPRRGLAQAGHPDDLPRRVRPVLRRDGAVSVAL